MHAALVTLCAVGAFAYTLAENTRVEEIGKFTHKDELKPDMIKTVKSANRTFLLPNMVMEDGVVFAVAGYFRRKAKLRIQIWRNTDFWMKEYRLISETTIVPTVLNKWSEIYIKDASGASCLSVQKQDRLGVVHEDEHTIPFVFLHEAYAPQSMIFVPSANKNSRNPQGIGQEVTFEQIALPYLFLITVYIDTDKTAYNSQQPPRCPTDLRIPDYSVSPTTTKPTSPMLPVVGPPGPAGLKGDKGDRGAAGAPGVCLKSDCERSPAKVQEVGASKESGHKWWQDSHLIMGILVWLGVLSFINFLLVCAAYCGCRYALRNGLSGRSSSVNENVRETVREYNYRGGRGAGARASTSSTTAFANMGFTNDDAGAVYSNNLNAAKGV